MSFGHYCIGLGFGLIMGGSERRHYWDLYNQTYHRVKYLEEQIKIKNQTINQYKNFIDYKGLGIEFDQSNKYIE